MKAFRLNVPRYTLEGLTPNELGTIERALADYASVLRQNNPDFPPNGVAETLLRDIREVKA